VSKRPSIETEYNAASELLRREHLGRVSGEGNRTIEYDKMDGREICIPLVYFPNKHAVDVRRVICEDKDDKKAGVPTPIEKLIDPLKLLTERKKAFNGGHEWGEEKDLIF